MSLLIQKFKDYRKLFNANREREDGSKVMKKVEGLLNELGNNFLNLNGGELAEIQIKLSGYKFYLSDYIGELERMSEALKLQQKEVRAERWDEITAEIKSAGKPIRNKEQIENVLLLELREVNYEQILYQTLYTRYKLRYNALNDVLTAIVQRVADIKNIIKQTKQL